jgi:hypothetical protein
VSIPYIATYPDRGIHMPLVKFLAVGISLRSTPLNFVGIATLGALRSTTYPDRVIHVLLVKFLLSGFRFAQLRGNRYARSAPLNCLPRQSTHMPWSNSRCRDFASLNYVPRQSWSYAPGQISAVGISLRSTSLNSVGIAPPGTLRSFRKSVNKFPNDRIEIDRFFITLRMG